ncbi:DUF4255 domain-containing protein [Anabaena sp. FACHB-1250]|uniref:Pvc16 N-terminal domain-containing protein n=1 Tax=Dolichospermum planctonicum TaxID=136072 RepID=A0A480A7C0_9CYAN|nr:MULTISPECIES: DUF4255 domain-containing protein [Nostocales]MBD2142546.1 DUF4255 domain-containing protein [Anabaena sp. FACHB-1250]MBD2268633.1 DUF4255 domain-containing protein [Anabaena sp. FACHB-1391]GCL40759.1 hypothetical protein NIES80_04480 [Dolichospermum planctonicum]
MLKDLDETLKLLLSNNLKNDVIDQRGYKISFEPPSQDLENEGTIINLFLYDIRENVELRSSVRSWDMSMKAEGVSKRVFASTRVDCSYLITVWTNRPQSNRDDSNQVPFLYEHQILGEIMQILVRSRYIPSTILQGTLKKQELPVPIISLRSGQVQNLGEFWQAIGGKPKASIHCTVTIPVPYVVDDEQEEVPLIKTSKVTLESSSVQRNQQKNSSG